ncbi:dTDP-4-dehydrorhamnose reductase [Winogradskyella sp. Asnod2-B02-A]|uniref:dTDP-4-dehydrorhamnose reductase n=1 Tax=Winogradskyella sp. Asnod2-B02-A TaxID=3160583 RepID=UPI00386F0F06
MKKVIVLGSNGQLGKTIKDFSETEAVQFVFFSRSEVDITNKNSLITAFDNSNFDYCINCAAYTNVEAAETNIEDAFLINAEGAKNIAEVCNSFQVKLIHISTDYVFDGDKDAPYTVSDDTNPINQYGKSKLKGELNIQEHLKMHYIIRVSWLYSLHGKNFVKTIIDKIKNDATLNITTEEKGTPTSCIDLVAFILHIIKGDNMPYGIYNFSANGSTTWYGFAKEIARNYSAEKIENINPSAHFKTIAKRPKYSVFDLTKTQQYYKVLNTWQESVGALVEKYKMENN